MIMPAAVKNLWSFRGFIFASVKRDYQLRYRGTMLGIAWTVLQPLAMILVYTVIFSQIMKSKLPDVGGEYSYSIYLCTGIIFWGLFAEIIQRSQSVFLDNANLLKKINFPRLALPIIVVATAFLNFVIIFSLFIVFLALTGNMPGLSSIAIIPLLLIQVMFAAGLGTALGILNVFFRDTGQFSSLLLQFWFWATPIVYPMGILPDSIQSLVSLNPMAQLIQGYQSIFVHNQWPQWQDFAAPTLIALVLVLYALNLFRRHAGEIVDEL